MNNQYSIHTLQEGFNAYVKVTTANPPPTIEEVFKAMNSFASFRRLPEALFGGPKAWYEPFPEHFPAHYERPIIVDKAYRAAWIPFLADQTARGLITLEQFIILARNTIGYEDILDSDIKYTEYLTRMVAKRIEEIKPN